MSEFSIEFNFAFEDIELDGATRQMYEEALRLAADAWATYIADDFDPIRPGTNFQIVNPSDPSVNASYTIGQHIDDILIFVGWDDLGDFEMVGSSQRITGGRAYSGATQFFGDSLSSRIVDDYKGQSNTDYEPWTGSITFNSRLLPGSTLGNTLGAEFSFSSYDEFDPTTEANKIHFISTAVHEIGHILGIGASPAFEAQIVNDVFTGMNATAVSVDGTGIPLDPDEAHVADGYANNTVAMDPVDTIGTVKGPGVIDFALLADIGYHIKDFDGQSYVRQGERRELVSDNGETVSGTTSRDVLYGEGGNDTIFGNDGDDVLSGGAGDDWMVGGEGSDVFEYGFHSGNDGIQDFDLVDDLLRISSHYGLTPEEIANQAVNLNTLGDIGIYRIDFGSGDVLTVQYDKHSGADLTSRHIVVANTDRGGFSSPIWQSDLDAALHDEDVTWREQSVYWTSYENHSGIDFSTEAGVPIRAIADGDLYRAFFNSTSILGNVVILSHGDQKFSLYAHLDEFGPGLELGQDLKDGIEIRAGEIIGYSGNSGLRGDGNPPRYELPHLHLSFLDYSNKPESGPELTGGSLGKLESYAATYVWSGTWGDGDARLAQYDAVGDVLGASIQELADQPKHNFGGLETTTFDKTTTDGQTVFYDGIIDRAGNSDTDTFAFVPQEGRTYKVTVTGAPIRDYHALDDPQFNIRKSEINVDLVPELGPRVAGPSQLSTQFEALDSDPHYIRVGDGGNGSNETGGYTLIVEDVTNPETEIVLATTEQETYSISDSEPTTIFGKIFELVGDTISNFWNRDEIRIQEPVPNDFRIREGSAIIEFDLDGDGTFETSWTLEGDFSNGDFFLLQGAGTTTIAFAEVHLGTELSDTQVGNDGRDRVYGVSGDDTLRGLSGEDTLDGGTGDDRLEGGLDSDHLDGGEDNDELYGGGSGDDTLIGGRGSDFLFGENGNDFLDGGDGFDLLNGGTDADTMLGGNGNDRLFGNLGDDSLEGGAGNDTMYGGPSGNDILKGGDNDDVLYGESGKDYLQGDSGNDTLIGGGNDDTLLGGDGDDSLDGGAGNDELFGGPTGADTLKGGQGSDFLYAESANDVLDGGDGFDLMNGGAGDDLMLGGNGNDRLEGNLGEDTLDGGAGDDELYGGNGGSNDTLIGGTGNDTLVGEAGSDTFAFAEGFGIDVINDFDAFSSAEVINLAAVTSITDYTDLSANHMSQAGGNVLIDAGSGNTITVLNALVADMGADDFAFV